MVAFLGTVAFLTLCAGTDRLLGDEVGYAHAASWHTFRELRFYRILGEPLHIAVYKFGGRWPLGITVLSAGLIAGTLWYLLSVMLKASRPEGATMDSSLPALLALAAPFSLYGIVIRLVTTQMLASALMTCTCATAMHYARRPSYSKSSRRRLLFAGAAAYGASLFIYEITLLTPVLVFTLLCICASPVASRRDILREWSVPLAVPLALFLASQVAFMSRQPKLSGELAQLTALRAQLGFTSQAIGKIQVLGGYFSSAWHISLQNAARGDWHVWATIPAIVLAGAGAWQSSGRRTEQRRTSGRVCVTLGITIFACTIGLWAYYWIRFHVLSTPPLYAALLPGAGLALAAFGLFVMTSSGSDVRWMRARILTTFLVCAGVANNSALLNAARIAKHTSDAEALKTILTGRR